MDVTSQVEEESGSVASVVETESMSVFKSELKKYVYEQGIVNERDM